MKSMTCVLVSVISLVASVGMAVEGASRPPVSQEKTAGLPYGVEDVLKLVRAEVSEEIVLKFIENSGVVYNLSPELIVRLKNEGVSDRVVGAMLEQGKHVAATTSHWQDAPQQSPAPRAQEPVSQQQPAAPAYSQPPQPEPQPAPASTVHVIRHYPATYAVPYWPGYYSGSYVGWYGPRISLGFGFGFGHHHHRHFHCR